jgi:integrase/recombinase XerC
LKHGRLAANPLKPIDALPEDQDQRQPSRAMTHEEFAALLSACGERKLWYLLAGRMGLRWSEVRRLTWGQIDSDYRWLSLAPEGTKSRRGDALPIPSDVAEVMRQRPRGTGPIFSKTITLRTWKKDLVRAGLVTLVKVKKIKEGKKWNDDNLNGYRTDAGQLDRKSLRKTLCTHLAMARVDLRITQRLMRHSDPKLTAKVYTDPVLLDMQAAVETAVMANLEKKAKVA